MLRTLHSNGAPAPTDLGACVAQLVDAVAKGVAEVLAPHGLTHIDFALLRLFLQADEWTTTQLTQALPLAASGTSRTVTKLVKKGLLRRRRLRSDRRVVILKLTEQGARLTREIQADIQAYDANLCKGLSDEQMEALAAVASTITSNSAPGDPELPLKAEKKPE